MRERTEERLSGEGREDYLPRSKRNSGERTKINFHSTSESVGRGVTAEENLSLGKRKNSRRRRKKESRGELKKQQKATERPDGSPPLKVLFLLFVGSPRRGFLRSLHDSPLTIAFEEVLFFSCS